MATLEAIETERAARKEALAAAKRAQCAIDVARLNDLEIEYGDDGVIAIDVGRYSPGVVTLVVVRPLKRSELKRFRDRTRKEGSDAAAAAEEAADCALLYPDKSSPDWQAVLDLVPGLAVRVGVAAVQAAAGVEHERGK